MQLSQISRWWGIWGGSLLRGIRGRWRAGRELVGLADPPEGSAGWHSGLCLSMPNIVFWPALRHPLTVCPAASVELGRRNGSLAESLWILETKFGNLQSVFCSPMTWPTAVDGSGAARGSSWMSPPISGNKVGGGLGGVSLLRRRRRMLPAPAPRGSQRLVIGASFPCAPAPLRPCAPLGSRCGCRQRAAGHRDRGQMAWSRSQRRFEPACPGRVLTGDAAGGGQ